MNNEEKNLIDFISKTTEAITIISKSTEGMNTTLIALKDISIKHESETVSGFEMIKGKIESLKLIFLYIIVPLIGAILSFVGIKLLYEPK